MKSSSDCTERKQQQQQLQRGKPATALVNASERERAEIRVESVEKGPKIERVEMRLWGQYSERKGDRAERDTA